MNLFPSITSIGSKGTTKAIKRDGRTRDIKVRTDNLQCIVEKAHTTMTSRMHYTEK